MGDYNIENNICSNKFYKTKKYLIIHESKCNVLIKGYLKRLIRFL